MGKLKYRLIGNNDYNNVKTTILTNRGVKNINEYLNLNKKVLNNHELLDGIADGIKLIKWAIDNNLTIYIVVDCDVDGYSSASRIYTYIKNHLKYDNIIYLLHTGKQHGLTKDILSQINVNNVGLIISPDGGTNDADECYILSELGFKVLVIDHHEKEKENQYATIINNQICAYPNKNLCGMGVVNKFIEACDDEFWTYASDEYLDINALANISDSMDLRECETKYIVNEGLKFIEHPLLKAILQKQSFSVRDVEHPTITEISFYVTPLLNAIARMGKQEEKDLMFKAFAKEYEEFTYVPRKSKNNPSPTETIETIYERVARIGTNVRAKQNKIRDNSLKEVVKLFDKQNKENSICFINATKLSDDVKELSGLIAIKVADMYNKPCLVLKKDKLKSNGSNILYSGSVRNVNDGLIDDLKEELRKSRLFDYLIGHANAFGATIKKENIPIAIDFFNKKLNKPNLKKVDFVLENEINYKIIKDIYSMNSIFSSFVKEPVIVIKNIKVDMLGFELNENEKTHKKRFTFSNGVVEFIKFNVTDDDELSNSFEDINTINVIGKATINTYGGKSKPQFIIEDYELIE